VTDDDWSENPIVNLSERVGKLEESLTPQALHAAVSRALMDMLKEDGDEHLEDVMERVAERAVRGHEARRH
jgi:hypothetical protein